MKILPFVKRYIVFIRNSRKRRDAYTWIFGEWFGKKVGDNSAYLANYIAEAHPEISAYWLCSSKCDTSALDKRIRILDYSTEEAREISRKAGVAVMGEGIADLDPNVTNYVGNAVKVNVWHGMMWKKIGDDAVANKGTGLIDRLRDRMYSYDLFEVTSEEYAEHIKTGFRMRDDQLIRAGMPRNRLFFDSDGIRACARKVRKRIGAEPAAKIICYLPTFRDSHVKPFSFTELKNTEFSEWLEENDIYIIQKAHFADTAGIEGNSGRILTINDIPAQELMAASEMLVTDYSSCFFDYLLLDRPIIHYLYDYDYFRNKDRGLYYEKEEIIGGAEPDTEEGLIAAIRENFEDPERYHELREERKKRFMTYESPDNCEKIIQSIYKTIKH